MLFVLCLAIDYIYVLFCPVKVGILCCYWWKFNLNLQELLGCWLKSYKVQSNWEEYLYLSPYCGVLVLIHYVIERVTLVVALLHIIIRKASLYFHDLSYSLIDRYFASFWVCKEDKVTALIVPVKLKQRRQTVHPISQVFLDYPNSETLMPQCVCFIYEIPELAINFHWD